MKRLPIIGVTAVATASPAFVVDANATGPMAAEGYEPVSVTQSDVRGLKDALLSLSPGAKLRIAGDRIRLAKSGTTTGGAPGINPGKATPQGAQPHPAAKMTKPRTDISTQCNSREYCDKR